MPIRLTHTATLFFYDGIQVFEGRDRIGGHYVGVLVSDEHEDQLYAVVGVAPEQLQRFRLAEVDLATLMKQSVGDGWYIAKPVVAQEGTLAYSAVMQPDALPADYLPAPGFLLPGVPEVPSNVGRESAARGSLALVLGVESRIPSEEHRLNADTMGGLLINVQSLVKNGFRKSVARAGGLAKDTNRDNASLLDVAAGALPGSVRVVLVPAVAPDLFGTSPVSRGLEVVDYLLAEASDPQATLQRVREYSGHTAAAFVRLLKFIIEKDLAISYAWASPDRREVSERTLSKNEAVPLYALLSATASLATEPMTLVGRLRKIDVDSHAWRLQSSDGKEHSGKAREGVSLSGLVTDSAYTFYCEEATEEVTGTGREIRTLYLLAFTENPTN